MFSGKNGRTDPPAQPCPHCPTKKLKSSKPRPWINVIMKKRLFSHSEREIRSTPVNFAGDILLLTGNCDVVGIDEAQFFDEAIVEVCNTTCQPGGKRVDRGRIGYGLSRQALLVRCPNLLAVGRIRYQSSCDLCTDR